MNVGEVVLSLPDVTLSRREDGGVRVYVCQLHGGKDSRGHFTNVSNPSLVRSLGAALDIVEEGCNAPCCLVISSSGKYFSNGSVLVGVEVGGKADDSLERLTRYITIVSSTATTSIFCRRRRIARYACFSTLTMRCW